MARKQIIDEVEEFTSNSETINNEETLAAASLHPAARAIPQPQSKIEVMQHVLGMINGMNHQDLTHWFNATMAQFGPGKEYGVGDNAAHNASTIAMKPSAATVKEDLAAMFEGQDLSEEFKTTASTLFEAAISARIITETARLEEEYENKLNEEIAVFSEEVTSKLDSYLNYVVENWMKDNEVAIESTLRNELMEEFIEGLRGLFAEHYISVPQEQVDVLEALAEKVEELETKLDYAIEENTELRGVILEDTAKSIFVELAADLALTQQEKFAALAEGVVFDGDLETFEKKLKIIKENYFKNDASTYSSNIEEETFEGEVAQPINVDPNVNRYVQAIARTIKK